MTVAMLVVGIGFALMGVGALIRPALVAAQFGGTVSTAEERTEIRAVYGGFGIAMALLLWTATAHPGDVRDGIALAVGVALAGMAFGRIIGMVIERPGRLHPTTIYLLIELVAAAALLIPGWS